MKSRIKTLTAAIAILAIALLLCSCGSKEQTEPGELTEAVYSGTALNIGENAVAIEGKDSSHFYFIAENDGVYAVAGAGAVTGSAVFYDSDKYRSEINPETVNSYPNEEFATAENPDFLYAFDMHAGDAVYFSVSLSENGDYTLFVSEAGLTPDRTSCTELIDRFNGSYYTFNYNTICSENPEAEFASHLNELILGTCTTGTSGIVNKSYVTTCTKGALSNEEDLSTYITEEEAQSLGLSGGVFFIYDLNTFAQMPNELWGSGRITEFGGEDTPVFLSSQGYLFVPEDRTYVTPYELIGISDFTAADGFAKATIVGLGYDLTHPVYDINDGKELGINVFLEAYSTLSEASGILNIDLSTLSGKDFIFYNTAEGTRLFSAGSTVPNGVVPAAPALPSTIPDEYFPETLRTVSSIGGLALQSSPGSSSSVIIKIPDKYTIRTYAEDSGFYYVKYMGCYGWVDASKCR